MIRWMNPGFVLSAIALAQLLTACGSSRDPSAQNVLQAQAQSMINGMQSQLVGQFQTQIQGKSLKAELDNINLAMGTAISFCLVTQSGRMPLAAPQIAGGMGMGQDDMAEFELDGESTVPNVVAGNMLEARQGAMASGMADCGAPLLMSATFQSAAAMKMTQGK